jgi:hypothetical protein
MNNKFGPAIRHVGIISHMRSYTASQSRPVHDASANATPAPAESRRTSSIDPAQSAPLRSGALGADDSQDLAKAKAELLGQIYSLTGAGS